MSIYVLLVMRAYVYVVLTVLWDYFETGCPVHTAELLGQALP
jgi:hypothetical protein